SWNLADARYEFSPSFVYNQINGGGDNGSTFDDAFTLMQNKGTVDIAEFPYNQSNYTNQPSAMQLQEAKPYRIPSGWTSFWTRSAYGPYSPANDITNAKGWLASGKLLVFGIPIYNDWPDYGSNPARSYYDYNGSSTIAGGHGVCIVGYDDNANPGGADADHRGGFKMVNSWGAGWNGNGFVYLSYDFVKRYVWEAWTMGDNAPDTPSISSLSAGSGNIGDTIQVNGGNFGGLRRNAKVTFNGAPASGLTWTNERVTVTVPAGASTGPVVVCDWEGNASNSVQFTVGGGAVGPSITSISPTGGGNTTSVPVILSGSGFEQGCSFKLARSAQGDINATGVTFSSEARVDGNLDLSGAAEGSWDVVLTNPGGQSATLSGGFTVTGPGGQDTYEPNDTPEAAYGPLVSGRTYASYVWEDGDYDFYKVDLPGGTPSLTADLKTVPAGCDYDLYVYDSYYDLVGSSLNPDSEDERVVLTSPEAGTYFLLVEPYAGSSQTGRYGLVATFAQSAVPRIAGISPRAATNRTAVTITGTGFGEARGGSFVSFGPARVGSADYLSWSDSRITCRVPAAVGGRINVVVATGGGRSSGFPFSVIPAVSTVSPSYGRPGALITINGQGFGSWSSGRTLVYFGGTRASQYYAWNNGRIQVRVPRAYPGRVALTVRTAGGTSQAKSFTILR
ncbi:MAG: IPT/TIG domain-containing protein, partial [Candidatus Geothermincolia bacterium]